MKERGNILKNVYILKGQQFNYVAESGLVSNMANINQDIPRVSFDGISQIEGKKNFQHIVIHTQLRQKGNTYNVEEITMVVKPNLHVTGTLIIN